MRVLVALLMVALLASCAGPRTDDASPERVLASRYVPAGAPKLTLVTVVNNRTGKGGHTALMVSGSEQVIFDPAGSFQHPDIPKRQDVIYGVTAGWFAAYKSAHARTTYHVVTQEVTVTPQQAETALQLVKSNGAVGSAFCANATSSLLRQVPGFSDITTTFYPVNLQNQFAKRSGVRTDRYYENDAGDVLDGVRGVAQ